MPKKRSSASQKYNQQRDKRRGQLRAKHKMGNHPERNEMRKTKFEELRAELSRTFGIPSNCHIYFLKKYPKDSLPQKPRLRITFGNSVILDADTWKVIQVNRFTRFLDMSHETKEDMEFAVQTLYQHTLARGEVKINGSDSDQDQTEVEKWESQH
ncbi:uncharacterized protein MELLADRAFT_85027 [Melampsora larici-populina 98AG31]|uniref:Uncharacterized protein n=1 Tax=Melampsora larici-populina (strain 98AG31 / pathotype 3-4-7) TaxID=747676 RepID=F4RH26_MELLP|nr:uncharacterized protein MELLADRAFT_85027 [Melampsora larici-populina 98AG31]EGG08228.1 hypothetical protein MELLADRAFT_85027 [Melampsora larici-populina 98AG31]